MRKHIARKRARRVRNGTTVWKVTIMNPKAVSQSRSRKVRATYDEITALVHRTRARNRYNAVVAEEMHKWGGSLKEDGRVVALDSIEDEKILAQSMSLTLSDILENGRANDDYDV